MQTIKNELSMEYDLDDTDDTMKQMIKNYESLSNCSDVKSYLALKNIRLRHPIFQKLSQKVFQYLMEYSFLYKLKQGQYIYRESIAAAPNIYIIMYGQFAAVANKAGVFGPCMCVGHTLGEEMLFGQGKQYRTESVLAKVPSCVLQVRKDVFLNVRRLKDRSSSNGLATKDFMLLRFILMNHYE